ncbi:MAG: glycosyltransferase, partial [Chthoniobacterales bacterium]
MAVLQDAKFPDAQVIVYANDNANDAALIAEAKKATSVVLVPDSGVDVATRRPELVESFGRSGFVPDYEADLTELDSAALRLVRQEYANGATSLASVEAAIGRLHQRMRGLERTLRTRMSELEAADRHIAKLEEKIIKLKEAKKQLKQLKEEKQALRKAPERKVGQVLLAPYLLPKKLIREVQKRRGRAASPESPATEYQRWFERHRATTRQLEAMSAEAKKFSYAPLVSIVTPVFNTPNEWLQTAVESVQAQVYGNWELLLVDDASTNAQTIECLQSLTSSDARIRLVRRERNSGISAASNNGIKAANGEWIGLLDHDDALEPDALFHTVKLLQKNPTADLIYSDEDKITEAGLDAPFLKPDWSPDFFLSYNYLCHFTIFRRSLIEQVGGFRSEFDGAQDYDLFLRIIERTQRIHHIPRVLYHWRRTATSTADNIRRKPEALEAGRKAIHEHLQRGGESGYVAIDWRTHGYWVKREIKHARKISIIIGTRDRIPLLSRCIETLVAKTSYREYEIVIVDNDSASDEARHYFMHTLHRVLRYEGPFNFSAMNNFAVEQTDSPWLLFLNNDVEVIEKEWLTAMVEHVQRP